MWCADPWLISRCAAISFTVMQQFSFTMASSAAMAFGVTTRCAWPGWGESVTEIMPFMNFLVHVCACCSDRHASPYWTFIHWWILMGFTPSLLKKRMTERCSSLVHVASRAAIFALLLCRCVAFLPCTATCQPLFKPWISLSTYKTIELCFEFLSHFWGFHLTLPCTFIHHWTFAQLESCNPTLITYGSCNPCKIKITLNCIWQLSQPHGRGYRRDKHIGTCSTHDWQEVHFWLDGKDNNG